MSGTELLQEIRKKHPDTIRVILSGYADAGSIINAINKGEIYRFMAKPWNDEELKLTLRQCLEDYQLMEDTRNLAGEVENQNKQLDHLNQNLEQIIEKRTRDLKLCQEIFEHLPIPLVGIALEKIIVLVNRAFRGFFKNDPPVYPGVELNTLFSQQTIGHIEQALGGASAEPGTFEWKEKKVSYRLEPLVENGSPQGCLMMLETMPHE
jgi:two-component system NtrC family sensor kinase